MKPILDLAQLGKRKATLLAVSLGLAVGFAGGQMLHSEAQSLPKIETARVTAAS